MRIHKRVACRNFCGNFWPIQRKNQRAIIIKRRQSTLHSTIHTGHAHKPVAQHASDEGLHERQRRLGRGDTYRGAGINNDPAVQGQEHDQERPATVGRTKSVND